ncbi:hypothetical protein H4Q26_002728 [Puccinia striiformis f. sp. tritici PST-130]|nr:hypothetical protein H4Q26_002728 [Puccinia striiformis f. sp. tritici PST-130]
MQDSTTHVMADKDEDPVEQPKIPCKKCDKMFFTDGMRKTRVRKEHQDSAKVTLHNGTQATVNREPDKGFSCPTPRCTSVSTNPNNLQSHAPVSNPGGKTTASDSSGAPLEFRPNLGKVAEKLEADIILEVSEKFCTLQTFLGAHRPKSVVTPHGELIQGPTSLNSITPLAMVTVDVAQRLGYLANLANATPWARIEHNLNHFQQPAKNSNKWIVFPRHSDILADALQ